LRVFISILLGICALHDLHNKKIPALWIWISIGVSGVYRIYMCAQGKCSMEESLFCMIPGILFLLFANSGRQVGSGDGWLIFASGLYLKWQELMLVLCYSFMAAGLLAVGYLLFIHKKVNDRIPFVPFLFLGTMSLIWRDLL